MDVGAAVIPLNDLRPQHDEIAEEVRKGWDRVCHSGRFILGEQMERFEDAFARYCGRRHCVAVGSGTDALEFALRACGVGVGDRVAVPVNSYVASAAAVCRAGAGVAFVDADTAGLADRGWLAAAVRDGARAVMPVHLYGQVCPLDELWPLIQVRGVTVVEDAAQAHGATRHGTRAGAFGHAAAFSFHPSKNLGAYGDGGAVVTDSAEVAARVRVLRSHGERTKYLHTEIAGNSRMDELQAVVLSAKLARLDRWNALRRQAAARYQELLTGLSLDEDETVGTPAPFPGNEHVWHLYVVEVPHRDRVLAELHRVGVMAGMHYPRPIHLQPAFAGQGHREEGFPVAERRARRVLSLPLFPGITPDQQARVVAELERAIRAAASTKE